MVKKVKELGGLCLKYSNPGMVGYPDRVILLQGGITIWVELKSRGQKPREIQEIRIQQLRDLGHNVAVVSSKDEVDTLLECARFFRDVENEEDEL